MALRRHLLKKALHFPRSELRRDQHCRSFSSVSGDFQGELPPFDYVPKPYKGPLGDKVLEKRKRFLGPSLFHYYQKPIPSYLSSRKEFSTASHTSNGAGSTGKPSESKSNLSKVIIVNVVVGAAALMAYQAGYLDQLLGKNQHSSLDSSKIANNHNEDAKDVKDLGETVVLPNGDEPKSLSPDAAHAEENINTQADVTHIEELSEGKGDVPIQVADKSNLTPEETLIPIKEKEFSKQPQNDVKSEEQSIDSGTLNEGALDMKSPDTKTTTEMNGGVNITPISTHASAVPEANDTKAGPRQHLTAEDMPEDAPGKDVEPPSSLLDAYDLRDTDDAKTSSSGQGTNDYKHLPREEEASIGTVNDAYVSEDGKLVLDLLEAIHAAEKRQAELDAHVFGEEKRMLKEKYEKELKDARARQLMYAEEAAMLDKELNKERIKAAAAVKSLQEKAEEKLRMELERKENEAEVELKKIQELAKAELAAAIASEKVSQIEKMAEANLNINALCMAFYARSEEARQTHSVHKLALGALAIEETLSKGLPVQTEIEALHKYLEGIDKDPLIDLVLSSLPDETRHYGTDTLLQLNQKFDALKGTLRHFSLIPPGGGGILAHSLAHIASSLKVKEVDQSGDGIESVINRVESYLAEGKLAEAADILEEGVKGSQAAEVVGDWVRRARNRAISEQALTLLRSYATSISLI